MLEHKSCNISETEQDITKVTIDCLPKVISAYEVSIGAKIMKF